ncbi:response regulator transcription factor [Rhizobium sp. CECT 9324]|uniref:helix-turn-helix transcriptional regulator n=1 Tax=Rhizobium sp. CECT 9324 TaxID=2845820 RepID=UPI001E441313|nr:response regulator transcription factor [Rhizobium sp. CECT 9324]CAH0342083.1 Oxygen regulatory protein NreC [Rhizobium sp. CECT 9324]
MENTSKIRVLVLDENPVLVDGLSFLINSTRQLEALALTQRDANLAEAIKRLAPQVIVADPGFLDRSLRDCEMDLKELRILARLIAYCDIRDTLPGETYIARGYSGVVTKTVASPKLLRAIKSIHAGDIVIDESVIALSDNGNGNNTTQEPEQGKLSTQEELVLRYVALGKAMKEIAADIQLSTKTVETYKYRATKKLSLRTRSDIVNYAISVGWLQY